MLPPIQRLPFDVTGLVPVSSSCSANGLNAGIIGSPGVGQQILLVMFQLQNEGSSAVLIQLQTTKGNSFWRVNAPNAGNGGLVVCPPGFCIPVGFNTDGTGLGVNIFLSAGVAVGYNFLYITGLR